MHVPSLSLIIAFCLLALPHLYNAVGFALIRRVALWWYALALSTPSAERKAFREEFDAAQLPYLQTAHGSGIDATRVLGPLVADVAISIGVGTLDGLRAIDAKLFPERTFRQYVMHSLYFGVVSWYVTLMLSSVDMIPAPPTETEKKVAWVGLSFACSLLYSLRCMQRIRRNLPHVER